MGVISLALRRPRLHRPLLNRGRARRRRAHTHYMIIAQGIVARGAEAVRLYCGGVFALDVHQEAHGRGRDHQQVRALSVGIEVHREHPRAP